MKRWSILMMLPLVYLWVPRATAEEPLFPLRLLYIGNTKTPRPGHFADYLKKHFAQVTVADRDGFDVAAAQKVDVVLFDWGQQDSDMLKTAVPFGRLENWTKPTVLLNSAGLLVAGHWQLIGGAG